MSQSVLVAVKFVFPFRLAVPASSFLVKHKGKAYSLSAKSGPATRTLQYADVPNDTSAWVWLSAVFTKDGKRAPNREIAFTSNPNQFLAKVVDHIGFTLVDVLFETAGPSPKDDEARLQAIVDAGFEVARKFIDVYRELTNEPDVFHPTIEDSPGVEVFVAEEYSFTEDIAEGKFHHISRTIRWNLEHVTGAMKPQLSSSRMEELSQRLEGGHELSLPMELLLDAKDYSILHNHHRLAVVAVGSAFEVFLQNRLIEECNVRGIVELMVPNQRGQMRPVMDVVEGAALKAHLLDVHCRQLCGGSVKDSREYQAWNSHAYLLRNEIVHAGRREVNEAQARAAFESTVAFMNYVHARLVSSRAVVA